jgi:hypothetical protein
MAIEKTIELKVNATQADKALEQFGGTLEDVYGEGVQPLNFAIGELEDRLYEMASAGQTGTKEFKEMASEVGRMKKTIMDVDLAVDGFAMTTSQQLGGSLQGAASGFALAQGAMGLFGAESEEVEQAILKVQAAMAISEGVSGLREAGKSFAALGKSAKAALSGIKTGIAATGIGILLIAVGAIAAYWDDIKAALSGVNSEQARLNVEAQKNAELERQKLEDLGSQDNILKSQGFTERQILEMKMKQTDEAITAQEIAIDTAKQTLKSQIEASKRNKEFLKGALQFIMAPLDLLLKGVDSIASVFGAEWNLSDKVRDWGASLIFDPEGIEEEGLAAIEEQQKTLDKMKNDRAGFELQIKSIDKAAYQSRKAEKDKEAEEDAARLAEKLAQEKAFQEELSKMKKEAELARMEEEEELSEIIRQAKLSERELELEELDTHYFNLIERARQHGLDVTALEEEQAAKRKTLLDKYDEEDKAAKQKEVDTRKAVEDAKVQLTMDALTIIGDVAELFGSKNERAAKAAFRIQKAVSIASAVANTAQAITKVFAETTDVTPTQSLRIGNAIAIGAAGAVQIAKIASTKFEGGGSGSVSTPSISSGGGAAIPAEFNIVGNSGTNQLAESLGQPMKAYVVGNR